MFESIRIVWYITTLLQGRWALYYFTIIVYRLFQNEAYVEQNLIFQELWDRFYQQHNMFFKLKHNANILTIIQHAVKSRCVTNFLNKILLATLDIYLKCLNIFKILIILNVLLHNRTLTMHGEVDSNVCASQL